MVVMSNHGNINFPPLTISANYPLTVFLLLLRTSEYFGSFKFKFRLAA